MTASDKQTKTEEAQDAKSAPLPPPGLVDVRPFADEALAARGGRTKNSGKVRPWRKVTGICLHQTAVRLGERPGRWATLGAHVGITRAGQVLWVHDFRRIIYHGHGWNAQTVGIEIEGCFAGVQGDPKTFWRPADNPGLQPDELLPAQVQAAQATIRWICQVVAANGGRIGALVAHRQSSPTRRSDPGSAVWKAVALPMQEELRLGDGGPGFRLGMGNPIPEAWNPAYKGRRY